MTMTPAGVWWVSQYPTSKTTASLVQPFRARVQLFIIELERRGCTVKISATHRPFERAWLMYWAWQIARKGFAPELVPAGSTDADVTEPIPIEWSLAGALEMVEAYDLAYEPSLTSRHIQRRAIDMTITGWIGKASALYELGASYGVHKLVKDPPHWSDDGR